MNNLNFAKLNGLLPCIVQDAVTLKVLMLGFMNNEALQKTLKEKKVTFFSRTKKRLWTKGETSGNTLELIEIIPDCDKDTLLIKVKPAGPVCHLGSDTCFNEKNTSQGLGWLEEVIGDRKANPTKESYTSALFESGINRIAQKVGEEAVELVIEAKDENPEKFLDESADLLFHFLVLLHAKGRDFESVIQVLRKRHR